VGTALPSRPLVQTSSDIKQQLETAKTHFSEEAELAGLLGSDGENLKDAIQGDSYEVETRYRDFLPSRREMPATKPPLTALKRFATTK
jgi:hypothetical protein